MLRVLSFCLFCLLLGITGCARKAVFAYDVAAPSARTADARLLFLGYQLQKDTLTGRITTTLVQRFIANGKTQPALPVQAPSPGDVLICLLDAKGKLVAQVVQPNPFIKKVEGVSETGVLGYTQFAVSHTALLLRIGYEPRMKSVALFLMDTQHTKQPFFSHPL